MSDQEQTEPLLSATVKEGSQEIVPEIEELSSSTSAPENNNVHFIAPLDNHHWRFYYKRNPAENGEERKIQLFFLYWTKEKKAHDSEVRRKSSHMRDYRQDIYTVVGLYSVFQQVVFQTAAHFVTQVTSELTCRFSTIPLFLSLFVSAASFGAVWYKLWELQEHHKLLISAVESAIVLETRITECCKQSARMSLLEINFTDIVKNEQDALQNTKEFFNDHLNRTMRVSWLLLFSLAMFSMMLAFSIFELLCYDGF